MTRFLDGPAAGVTLQLRRAPYFLRVTDNGQEWDALNYQEDEAHPNERLYCYVWKERPGGMHLLIRGKNKHQGGFFQNGVYTFRVEQPSDEIMRDNGKWTQWCGEHISEFEAFTEALNRPAEKCPKCGSQEIEHNAPDTMYACGSRDYDQRPGTFVQSEKCRTNVALGEGPK